MVDTFRVALAGVLCKTLTHIFRKSTTIEVLVEVLRVVLCLLGAVETSYKENDVEVLRETNADIIMYVHDKRVLRDLRIRT